MQKILTGFLYGIIWFITLPPLRILYLGSWFMYLILRYLTSYRKVVIENNLRTSFPGLSEKDVRSLLHKYYRHLSQITIEAVKAVHWTVQEHSKRITLTNPEYLRDLAKSGKNLVVLAGHTGNWEWLPALISPYGYDLLGVYKRQSSPVFNELAIRIRRKEGVYPIAMRETARAIRNSLGSPKPKALLLIADQIPAKGDIHLWAEFLNKPTGWFTGGEKIAKKYDLPVVFMKVVKTSPGRYEGTAIPISLDPANEPDSEITLRYIKELEKNIRIQPENWLWSHRRWKHQPEDLSL